MSGICVCNIDSIFGAKLSKLQYVCSSLGGLGASTSCLLESLNARNWNVVPLADGPPPSLMQMRFQKFARRKREGGGWRDPSNARHVVDPQFFGQTQKAGGMYKSVQKPHVSGGGARVPSSLSCSGTGAAAVSPSGAGAAAKPKLKVPGCDFWGSPVGVMPASILLMEALHFSKSKVFALLECVDMTFRFIAPVEWSSFCAPWLAGSKTQANI